MAKKRIQNILKHVVCILLCLMCRASILYGIDQLF